MAEGRRIYDYGYNTALEFGVVCRFLHVVQPSKAN